MGLHKVGSPYCNYSIMASPTPILITKAPILRMFCLFRALTPKVSHYKNRFGLRLVGFSDGASGEFPSVVWVWG